MRILALDMAVSELFGLLLIVTLKYLLPAVLGLWCLTLYVRRLLRQELRRWTREQERDRTAGGESESGGSKS